jgi:uncharacterized protein (DUF1501 family)
LQFKNKIAEIIMFKTHQLDSLSLTRRDALKKSIQWTSSLGIAQSFAMSLNGVANAAIASNDYRSLVCIFLFGGNDHANTLIPYGDIEWSAYVKGRNGGNSTADLAGARSKQDLIPINASRITEQKLSLPKELGTYQDSLGIKVKGIAELYQDSKVAIVANVGPLQQPTARADYEASKVSLPQQLFSHLDNQNYWQSSIPSFSTSGWAGRLADLLSSSNGSSPLAMCMSLYGNNLMQTGLNTTYFPITSDGVIPNQALTERFRQVRNSLALNRMLAANRTNSLEQEYARRMQRSVSAENVVFSALQSVPALNSEFTSVAAGGNSLMDQLKTVARMIKARVILGQRRQVFFVGLGGFDSHIGLDDLHRNQLFRLNEAASKFYHYLASEKLTESVLSFTASDFGRCLLTNNRGSDHGWGGHHFLLGGNVKGGNVYGKMPLPGLNVSEDAGQGRLIPTTSVDQYAAEVAKWFGVGASDMPLVIPNINRFDRNSLPLF